EFRRVLFRSGPSHRAGSHGQVGRELTDRWHPVAGRQRPGANQGEQLPAQLLVGGRGIEIVDPYVHPQTPLGRRAGSSSVIRARAASAARSRATAAPPASRSASTTAARATRAPAGLSRATATGRIPISISPAAVTAVAIATTARG